MITQEQAKILIKLKDLLDKDLITLEEYEKQKLLILNPRKDYSSLISTSIEIIKSSFWPLIALLTISLFYDPLRSKLLESTEIGVGSFTLKIQEKAASLGSPQLGSLVRGLSKEEVKTLIELGSSNTYLIAKGEVYGKLTFSLVEDYQAFKSLESKKLVKGNENLAAFNKFFNSLKVREKIYYRSPDSKQSSLSYSNEHSQPFVMRYVIADEIDGKTKKRMAELRVTLTDKGESAFNLIVTTVADQVAESKPK